MYKNNKRNYDNCINVFFSFINNCECVCECACVCVCLPSFLQRERERTSSSEICSLLLSPRKTISTFPIHQIQVTLSKREGAPNLPQEPSLIFLSFINNCVCVFPFLILTYPPLPFSTSPFFFPILLL